MSDASLSDDGMIIIKISEKIILYMSAMYY